MRLTISSLADIPSAAKQIIAFAENRRIIAFFGEMGAGKTTIINGMVHELGVDDAASSPTFSLVNEYLSSLGDSIYHFDFYRIEDIEEAYDMGYEEYFYSGSYCLIEWSEKIEELLPEDTVSVEIKRSDNERIVNLSILN
jgi:tRNA threonylcarbamoyladenosine biosynthesis protein TsaE